MVPQDEEEKENRGKTILNMQFAFHILEICRLEIYVQSKRWFYNTNFFLYTNYDSIITTIHDGHSTTTIKNGHDINDYSGKNTT